MTEQLSQFVYTVLVVVLTCVAATVTVSICTAILLAAYRSIKDVFFTAKNNN